MGLTWTIEPRTGQRPFIVVHFCGAIDSMSAHEMDSALDLLTEQKHCTIIVDLAQVDYVSSAGWGAFIGAVRRAEGQGEQLVLVALQPQVREVLETLGLNAVIPCCDTLDDAVKAVPRMHSP